MARTHVGAISNMCAMLARTHRSEKTTCVRVGGVRLLLHTGHM